MEEIFNAMTDQISLAGEEEVSMGMLYTAVAFNRRPDRRGFSPRTRVFGNEERMPASVLDNLLDGEELAGLDLAHGDEVYKRSLMIRDAAMMALTKFDCDARWRKALATNVPAHRGEFPEGATCFIWKKARTKRNLKSRDKRLQERWHGPCVVVKQEMRHKQGELVPRKAF